jgi:hypothetical protein
MMLCRWSEKSKSEADCSNDCQERDKQGRPFLLIGQNTATTADRDDGAPRTGVIIALPCEECKRAVSPFFNAILVVADC